MLGSEKRQIRDTKNTFSEPDRFFYHLKQTWLLHGHLR